MAAFAGTQALTYFRAAAGPAPGILEFTFTLSTTTYVDAGTIGITALKIPIDPFQVKSVFFSIESSAAAYLPVWTPAATSAITGSNLGALSLFTATGTKASGSLTLVLRCRATLTGPGGVNASIIG